ncbi:unnamed protein product [Natator depressus]
MSDMLSLQFLPTPTPVVYVNVSQGHSDNKEFQFNINGENRFGAQITLQILVPICIQKNRITNIKNITRTQVFIFLKLFQCAIPVPQTFRRAGLDPY